MSSRDKKRFIFNCLYEIIGGEGGTGIRARIKPWKVICDNTAYPRAFNSIDDCDSIRVELMARPAVPLPKADDSRLIDFLVLRSAD
jgi:hypothetical protein